MSESHYGSNGSVHWEINHYSGMPGNARRLSLKNAGQLQQLTSALAGLGAGAAAAAIPNPPAGADWVDLTQNPSAQGYDPVPQQQIGPNADGKFRVTARYRTAGATNVSATTAAADAAFVADAQPRIAGLQKQLAAAQGNFSADQWARVQTAVADLIRVIDGATAAIGDVLASGRANLEVNVPGVTRAQRPQGGNADPWEVTVTW